MDAAVAPHIALAPRSGFALRSRQTKDRRGGAVRAGNGVPYRKLSIVLSENLHTPRSHPPHGAERRDEALQVEGPLSAKAAAVSGVFEESPHDDGVGVAEFHTDDVAERNLGKVRRWGVRAFGVPHVDDETAGLVVRVLDKAQPVVDCLDV
jgi:hypothetical protein